MAYHFTPTKKGKDEKKQKVKKNISNLTTRLANVGVNAPSFNPKAAFSTLGKAVNKGLEIASRPNEAVKVGIKYHSQGKSALEGARRGLTGQETYSGAQVMRDLGVNNKAGQLAGGFAVDVATDPLNLVTAGLGAFGKGAVTGTRATLTADGLRAMEKAQGYKALQGARKSLMNENMASTYGELLQKMGKSSPEVDTIIKRRAYGAAPTDARVSTLDLQRQFNERARKQAQLASDLRAGKGFTIGGKTIVSGRAMQDAGAAVSKSVSNIPYVGDAMRGLRDTAGSMFKSHYVSGMDGAQRQVLDSLINAQKGTQNILDERTVGNLKNLGILQKDATFAGRPLDSEIGNMISTGREGLSPEDLRTVISTTPEQQRAARALGMPEQATLGHVLDYYDNALKDMAVTERQAGVLTNVKDNYFPRILSEDLDKQVRRGGMTRNFSVNNAFNMRRNEKYDGKSIAEINQMVKESRKAQGLPVPENFKLFEESALRAFTSRALSHNKILADKQVTEQMLQTFGKRVRNQKEVRQLMNEGFDIVVPRAKVNLINIGQVTDGIASNVDASTSKVVKGALEQNAPLMQVLTMSDALNFVGDARNTVMYALPRGLASSFNKNSKQQMDEGIKAVLNVVDAFNNQWKPLVTGLNPKFHVRNLNSALFNNFIDLGKDMLAQDTQKMALAVTARDSVGKSARIKINGKDFSSKQIYDMMVENNALSAFNTNEATAIARGAAKDVAETAFGRTGWQKANHLGRAAGNRVEEYARAVNFIGHLKQGMSPANAAEMVRKYHFDYTDLSNLEKSMKKVLPFYTWVRKNLPLQLESILNDPRVYNNLAKLNREGADVTGLDYSTLPNYMQENMVTPYGNTEDGRVKVLDLGLPVSDLYTGNDDLWGLLSPLIKAPIELKMNKNILTGAPLYKEGEAAAKLTTTGTSPIDRLVQRSPEYFKNFLKNNPELAQGIDYGIKQTGLFSNLNKYGASYDDTRDSKTVQQGYERLQGGNAAQQMVNMLRGQFDPTLMSTKYVDPERAKTNQDWAYQRQLGQLVDALEMQGTEVPTMTEIKKRYKRKERR